MPWKCSECGFETTAKIIPGACSNCESVSTFKEIPPKSYEVMKDDIPKGAYNWQCSHCQFKKASLDKPSRCLNCGEVECFKPFSEYAQQVEEGRVDPEKIEQIPTSEEPSMTWLLKDLLAYLEERNPELALKAEKNQWTKPQLLEAIAG